MVAWKCPENRLEMVLLSIGQGGGELGPAAVLVVGLDAFFGSPKRRLASKKQRAFIHHHPCRLILQSVLWTPTVFALEAEFNCNLQPQKAWGQRAIPLETERKSYFHVELYRRTKPSHPFLTMSCFGCTLYCHSVINGPGEIN